MAISALELRPRGAIAILDAGLRVCVRSSGVWALTLPGGALVTAALLHLTDAVSHRHSLALPALWFTLAWLARGLFQGAACHHVQELVLGQGTGEPTAWASLRAALARAPSLLCAVAYLFTFNLLTLGLSLGFAFLFLSAHLVGYAVTLQGKGSPLGLYGVCSQMLGPARASATGVRILLLVQLLVFFNLHIGANTLLYVGRKLIGIDLTFAERFASLDNASWVVFLVAVTFTLFEPLRAATATLLLVDGRVRQEGLDLLAAVQQIPSRSPATGTGARSAALVLLAFLGTCLLATPARAEQSEAPVSRAALQQRVEELAGACELEDSETVEWKRTLTSLSQSEAQKLQRLVRDVEHEVYENEDCEAVERLEQGLTLAAQTAELEKQQADARASQARARDILSRPEFQVPDPEAPKGETPKEEEPPGAWQRFLKWLAELLEKLFRRDENDPVRSTPAVPGGGQGVANVLVVVLIAGVLVVLALVLLRALGKDKKAGENQQLEVSTQDAAALAADPMNALSRPPESWAHLADELAARGEYREAVRGLYLALLSRLHREGVIHYDTTLSNWDYLRQFRSHREWLPPFRELTLRFDFAWYGNLPVGADGYRDFRALCAPMLSTPATQEASGA
ncbi:DUF4129 domain-containing protein [Vitiosangium sp. GDMCC 1.1324]|uniref:DUF4129 domain-containing protein n=1 Tax=Vitiosangium sp. (strain GDMCC 1.1324) TaxID=2138576 RepID=UPI000D3AF809|nr:DUF4129 domain-containing protein [Vitiosangium sp. GDMCC 1.1324]PTL80474.1 DUF4129 domain-containing protein [Vitiosangium sp. GDMCC 1.1324]